MPDYDRAIATATRLIASAGAEVTWTKPAVQSVGADPWRDQRTGEPPTFHPKMAFFSVVDAGRGGTRGMFEAFMRGTEVPDVNEIGFLSGGCGFTPEPTDQLTRADGSTAEIVAIDKIDPTGTKPVLWFISVK